MQLIFEDDLNRPFCLEDGKHIPVSQQEADDWFALVDQDDVDIAPFVQAMNDPALQGLRLYGFDLTVREVGTWMLVGPVNT